MALTNSGLIDPNGDVDGEGVTEMVGVTLGVGKRKLRIDSKNPCGVGSASTDGVAEIDGNFPGELDGITSASMSVDGDGVVETLGK